MVTITMNDDFTLVCDTNVIPAQHSANIPFKFEVPEEYKDAIVVPGYIYYDGDRKNESAVSDYNNGQFSITNGFIKDGILGISFALTNGDLTETTTIIEFEVRRSVNTSFSLPSEIVWQDMLKNFMDQYMEKVYSSVIEDLIQKEEEHYQTTEQLQSKVNDLIKKSKQQQTQIDKAIETMGDYEIIQEDPTQIRFKKGDGTFGDTVNLGGGLASKNMVNAGYDTQKGNSFSGFSSNGGIELHKAEGNSVQETTNGHQLFDASKLPTKSQGGATVTNNGDGSFTVSGSGNLTSEFLVQYNYDVELTKKLLKTGNISFGVNGNISGVNIFVKVVDKTNQELFTLTKNNNTFNISEDTLNKTNKIIISFWGGSGSHIVSGTVKPMLYQDGDGTWEPFTGGMPSPNPEYPQEIKSFDVKEIKSSGKNLFDYITFCNQSNWTVDEYGNITHEKNDVLGNKFLETYLIQGDYIFTTENKCQIQVQKKDGSSIGRVTGTSMKFTILDSGIYNLKIFAINNDTIPYVIGKVMLNKGSEALPFEPFIGSDTTPLNLTLRSLPNGAKDTYENGVITRRVGVVEFDGSDDENWVLQSINSYGISNFRFLYASPVSNSVISNRFISQKELVADAKTEGIFNNTDQIFIRISKDKASTVEEFKTYLKTHKTIAFIEKTPTTEQVSLPTIPSYYPFTNAFHDSEVESNITWRALLPYSPKEHTHKKSEVGGLSEIFDTVDRLNDQAIINDTTPSIKRIRVITEAQYNSLSSKDDLTLYLISG